jgi:L-alanine-DL-glutamate epimerase-like enolase superfamily enzyme
MTQMSTIQSVQVLTASDPAVPAAVDVIQDLVLVSVVDDDGVTGFGESQTSPSMLASSLGAPPSRILRTSMQSVWQGRQTVDVSGILEDLRSITRIVGREGVVAHALSALEIALWDLQARVVGEPVWKVLLRPGLNPSGPRAYGTIWFSDIQKQFDYFVEQVRSGPLSGLKLAYEPDSIPSPDEEASFLRRLRRELGDSGAIYLDWQSQGEYEDLLRRFDAYVEIGLGWIEEPFDRDNLKAYEALAPKSPIPLAAGESETRLTGFSVLRNAGVSVLQPDLGRCGLRVASQVAQMGRDHHFQVVPHQWGSDLNRSSNMHWAIGLNLTEMRLSAAPMADSLVRWSGDFDGDRYVLPNAPGLGVDIKADGFHRLM